MFVAINVNGLKRLSILCNRSTMELILQQNQCGVVRATRYFLKEDALPLTSGKAIPKKFLKKVKCCLVNQSCIRDEVLERFFKGQQLCMH